MKRLDERTIEKKEVMHIHDFGVTCEEWRNWAYKFQLPRAEGGRELYQQQLLLLLSSLAKLRLEPAAAV